jgi:hypothetical protein
LHFACGAGGNSYRRWQWNKSRAWEYWIPGCLSESSTRFRKYFRISRERFDMIYEAAARSGQFGLNPEDPMYSTVYPGPTRPGRHQDFKRIPLCLLMAASFRRVASGSVFSTLAEEFHISSSALSTFDKKFWKWFRKEYWETWVAGVSGVGFDDITTIEQEEKLSHRCSTKTHARPLPRFSSVLFTATHLAAITLPHGGVVNISVFAPEI